MKVIKNIRSLSTKVYLSKFERIHIERANSTVSKFHSKSNISNNVMETDQASTIINDDSFNVVFNNCLHEFLYDIFPETIELTRVKLGVINTIRSKFPQLQSALNVLKPGVFFDNFLSGLYDATLGDYAGIYRKSYNSKYYLLNNNTAFSFRFKDDLGNIHSESKEMTKGEIVQGYTSVIECPLDDSTTTAKDGFAVGDNCSLYYYNSHYDVEFKLVLASTLLAASKVQLIVSEIDMLDVDKISFNTLDYTLNKIGV